MKAHYLLFGALIASTKLMAQTPPSPSQCPSANNLAKVELVVFAQRSSHSDTAWPRSLQLAYPEGTQALLPATTQPPFAANAIVALGAETHQLSAEVEKLKRGPASSILLHESWCHPLTAAPGNSVALMGGEAQGDHHALEGSVRIWQDRTPHAEVNLWLTDMEPAQVTPSNSESTDNAMRGSWPERPARPGAIAAQTTAQELAPPLVKRIVLHRQQSALKPGELQYLDHPVIGVLITISPAGDAPSTTGSEGEATQTVPQQ